MIDQIPATIMVAAGATVAAIVSALLTFVRLIVSKEETTSNFRQKWIDALRDDLSIFLTSVANISVHAQLTPKKKESGTSDVQILSAMSSDLTSAYSSYHRIVLRLNPEEHKKLIGLVVNLERSLSKRSVMGDSTVVGDLCAEIDHESHVVLKKEWERVKRGELTFVIVKYVSVLLLIVAISIGVILILD